MIIVVGVLVGGFGSSLLLGKDATETYYHYLAYCLTA